MEYLMHIIGFMLLFIATDVGRKQESKIKFFSGKWWLIVALILIGTIMVGI
jgi:hypothetical protein